MEIQEMQEKRLYMFFVILPAKKVLVPCATDES